MAYLDFIKQDDANSKVACETLVTTGQVVLAGEVKSSAYVDLMEVARRVINRIGYTRSEYKFEGDSCGVFSDQDKQTAFEFEGEDGTVISDILKLDSRFVSLVRWLGENHIHVRLSGRIQ